MIKADLTGAFPAYAPPREVLHAIRSTFRTVRRSLKGTMTIACVSDAKMMSLNKKWRGKKASTDVLSFSGGQSVAGKRLPFHWGDIVISPAYVARSAKEQRIPPREEFFRVLIHGVLHLFGYDHATAAEEKKMFAIQERVLQRI